MAFSSAGIPDSAGGVDEGVAIFPSTERQLENPEPSVDLIDGIARERRDHFAQLSSAGSGDDLRDALHRVDHAVGRLRKKSFVVVLVPIENQIGAAVIKNSPQFSSLRTRAVRAGAEEGPMPVRNRAQGMMIREISAEPLLLRG